MTDNYDMINVLGVNAAQPVGNSSDLHSLYWSRGGTNNPNTSIIDIRANQDIINLITDDFFKHAHKKSKMLKYILFIIIFYNCTYTPEPGQKCLDRFLNKKIESLYNYSSVSFMSVNQDSTSYIFIHNKNSEIFQKFTEKGLIGAHDIVVDLEKDRIVKITFRYISIGDPLPDESVVFNVLDETLCIKGPFKKNEKERYSYCESNRNNASIYTKYRWDHGLKEIITIEFNLIS